MTTSPTLANRLAGLSQVNRDRLFRRLAAAGDGERAVIRRTSPRDPAPLAHAQQRLWFAHQLDDDGITYTFPLGVRLSGPLNVPALATAIDTIVARHASLRTTFPIVNTEPMQVVTPRGPRLVVDVVDVPEMERGAAIRQLADAEIHRPFDLTVGPLFRARLVRFDADDHLLLLTMHHIVADGWSYAVLFRELEAVYTAVTAGTTPALPELPIQYVDYARWEREWLTGDRLLRLVSFWRDRLAGAPPLLEIEGSRPRPVVRSFRGARRTDTISAQVAGAAAELARHEQTTLFVVLLAAFSMLITHSTHRTDFVIGTDVANRDHAETADLIGFFVNVLPLRCDLGGAPSFRALVQRTRSVTVESYARQELSFDLLVQHLKVERTLAYNPIVQVLFVLQNTSPAALELPGIDAAVLSLDHGRCKFDIGLSVAEAGPALQATWNYSCDLFDSDRVAALEREYEQILARAVRTPDLDVPALLTEA